MKQKIQPTGVGRPEADSAPRPASDSSSGSETSLPRERGSHGGSGAFGDVAQVASVDLEVQIITLVDRLSTATFDLLVLIGELDARGTWALRGALSCAAWLADACDVELVTAHNQVRVARAMREFPELSTAMAAGDVSYSKARVLVPHLNAAHVDELVALASTTPAARLRMAIAAWSHRTESEDEIERRHQRERHLSWRTDPDGMVTITARLAPADAATVCAVIDKSVTSHRVADAAPAGVDQHPSLGQQRADALVRIATTGGPAGLVRPEVVIHVRDTGNSLADGTPLTDHAVTRLLPESFVSLLMLDAQRKPIDASPRRRFPTRRQRRVVDERFTECAHPGCRSRVLLQVDHVVAYEAGGPTVIDNLQPLCGPHNRAKARAAGRSGGGRAGGTSDAQSAA